MTSLGNILLIIGIGAFAFFIMRKGGGCCGGGRGTDKDEKPEKKKLDHTGHGTIKDKSSKGGCCG